MKKPQVISFIIFLALSITYSAHAQKGKKTDIFPKNNNAEKLARYAKEKAETYFIEGMKLYALKDYEESLEKFLKSEENDPKAASIKYQIAKVYFKLENIAKSKEYLSKALELEDTNQYFYDLQIQINFIEGNTNGVIATINKLINTVEDIGQDYYFDLASAHIQKADYKSALNVFQSIEEKFGFTDRLLDLQQRCYISLGEEDKAIELGEKLVEDFPENKEYLNAHIQMLTSLEKYEEAEKWLNIYSERFEVNGNWHLLIARIYDAQKKEQEFVKNAKIAFQDGSIPFDKKIHLVIKYLPYDGKQTYTSSVGKELTKIIYENHPEEAKASELYAEFLLFENSFKEARDIYLSSLKVDENNFNVWQKVIELDIELQAFDLLLDHTDQALIVYPNQPFFHLFNGLANQAKGDFDMAVDALEQAEMLSLDTDNLFKVQLYTQLGDAYQNVGEYEKSNKAYDQALKIDDNNAYVLNNYSYYLSLRNENLEKAREMGKKLISLVPNNPSYLDTYGWVLFMSELYAEARSYLEKAASASPNNSVIVEHYGDALYKLGEVDQAITQWQKAKQIGGNHSKDLDRKLAERKLID